MIKKEESHEFSRRMNVSCGVRMKQLIILALPYTCTGGLDIIIQLVSLSYTGHLQSSVYQSGLGLGISIVNVFGFSFLYGLAFGYDTFGSQAIGAQNYRRAGRYFNRARLILFVVALALFPIFIFTGNFLKLISVQSEIADSVNIYTRIVYLGVIIKGQTMLIRIHMKAQRVVWPTLAAQLISLSLHFGWLELFIKYLNFGFEGVCVATLIAFSTEFLIDYTFLHCVKAINKKSIQPFRKQDFKGWKQYLQIGCPTMMTVFAQWASYEVMNITVAYLGPQSLAAQAILSSMLGFLYLSAAGFGNTLTSLVGNSVGQGDAQLAKKFAIQGTIFTVIFSSSQSFLFYWFSPSIFKLFAADSQILALSNSAALYMALESIFDQFQCIQASILRGLAIVKPVFIALLIMQWGFYLPLQIGLAILTLKSLPAIWIVQAAIMVVISVICFIFVTKADWDQIAMDTYLKMMKKSSSYSEVLIEENRI